MKKVKDLMTTKLRTLERNDALSVADELTKERIRHLPVLEEGRLVGIVSQRDLLHAALSSTMGFGTKASEEFLRHVPVKEVMTEVITITPNEDIGSRLGACSSTTSAVFR